MKIQIGPIKEDPGRDLYWTRIIFISDDEKKQTQVLTSASQEYLENLYKTKRTDKLFEEYFSELVELVIAKWTKMEDKLFDQDVHYDVYSNTAEGEANGIDFLISKLN